MRCSSSSRGHGWRLAAAAVSLTLPVLAACGGGSGGSAAAAPAATSAASTTGGDAAAGGTTMPSMSGIPNMSGTAAAPTGAPVAAAKVAIQNFAFSPATIMVKVGATVTWTNEDSDPHTVTSKDGSGLDSPTLDKGATYQYTFTKPGQYSYLCTIHPFMLGTVMVTP
jgi:amicyanin